MDIIKTLAEEFKLRADQVEKTVALIDDGNTIPFIARYRKEVTGSLDDTVLRSLDDRLNYLRNIEKRKQEVRDLIAAQEKLTPEIEAAIDAAKTITEVDDIYRPFRPHRKTRASVAREKGLEPLAELLLSQLPKYEPELDAQAEGFVDAEKGVNNIEEAFAGACDIIAEDVSDNAEYRKMLRAITFSNGAIVSKQIGDDESVYTMYYDYNEPIKKVPDHRVLAMNRGEKEEFIKVTVELAPELALNYLFSQVIAANDSPARKYVSAAVVDGYDRLIKPSIEREIRSDMFDKAGEGAIKLFSDNLSHLLLQSPLKGKTVLGYDPGYRTGCKLAVVDKTGKVLDTAVIYPTKPQERIPESERVVTRLVEKYGVDIIAIGNGTASKESEIFIANLLKKLDRDVKYTMVSEAGASVYSASKLGAEEFPDFDVTQRSAVSIARRLQDPLAELVKIDPKSIGVGQYQHDMKPARLDAALTGVVEDCVNSVGVDLNTASHSLLSYISGINATSAKNIVKYREENGEFKNRAQILKVPKIGAKAFQQCAGFLRVTDSKEILDNTGVHPESYDAARALLCEFGYTEDDVRAGKLADLRGKVKAAGNAKVAEKLGIGEPTLLDIIGELEKPGRDLRDSFEAPVLRDDVLDMADLKPDMVLTGTVRNVIDFGAFVDIGVHQDGLVHISELSDKYVKHPSEVVSVGDIVRVRVLSVDTKRKRIGLSMKGSDGRKL
ncbi:MAG: RNA-binding transcriptional accessory protein [Ruminococcaceae bacterium]|nr:RNA-binding transcriptional accessory protein [Oscillospiraceae bacterium]